MSGEPKVKRRKITDYTPDPRNANKGTVRGGYMLEQSVQQAGAGRSLVASMDDHLPIGNHAQQAFVDAGIEDVIEVETDGRAVVVVKRTDWESVDDPNVRQASYFDNRTSDVGLEWSPRQIIEDQQHGVDLSEMWFDHELEEFSNLAGIEDGDLDEIPNIRNMGDRKRLIKMALYIDGVDIVERAIAETGERNRGEALVEICRAYLGDSGFDESVDFAVQSRQRHEDKKYRKDEKNFAATLRMKVFKRDGSTCQICGRSSGNGGVALEVDHIVPLSKGGETILDNLQTLCRDCNVGKSDRQ